MSKKINLLFRVSFVLTLALILGVSVLWILANGVGSLRWLAPPSVIEESLWERLPMHSSYEDVSQFLKEQGYRSYSRSPRLGFMSRDRTPIGDGHISASLGGYRLFFVWVGVGATFGFDKDGNLIAIEVRKDADAP